MAEDLPALIAETQRLLGDVIKKPKLTEGLLKKPPFRFLHDIVSEVHRATNFPSSEHITETELDSANYKDKDAKVGYLNMIMGHIGTACGRPVPAKPLKIVAGLEPENTNIMLQMLAEAAVGTPVKAAAAAPAPAPAPKQEEEAPRPAAPEQRPERPDRGTERRDSTSDRPPDVERKPETRPLEGTEPPPKRAEGRRRSQPDVAAEAAPAAAKPAKEEPPPAAAKPPPAPAASAGNGGGEEAQEYEPPQRGGGRMERPRTARRGPPKLPSNVVGPERGTAGKVAGRESPAMAGVIIDGADDHDDDEDEDDVPPASAADTFASQANATMTHAVDLDNAGALVRNIMASEQQIENESQAEARRTEAKDGATKPQTVDNKDKAKTKEEIDKLRASIQKMCQATNPLARCMDYVHEDVDLMMKELQFWKQDRLTVSQRLEEEQRQTEYALGPLHAQLRDLEEQVKEQQLKLANVKANVLRNDHTIKNLLRNVVRAH